MQVILNELIEKMWTKNAIQDARHDVVGIIQVVGQPNIQFGSNPERVNLE